MPPASCAVLLCVIYSCNLSTQRDMASQYIGKVTWVLTSLGVQSGTYKMLYHLISRDEVQNRPHLMPAIHRKLTALYNQPLLLTVYLLAAAHGAHLVLRQLPVCRLHSLIYVSLCGVMMTLKERTENSMSHTEVCFLMSEVPALVSVVLSMDRLASSRRAQSCTCRNPSTWLIIFPMKQRFNVIQMHLDFISIFIKSFK